MGNWNDLLQQQVGNVGNMVGGSIGGAIGNQLGYGLGQLTGYNEALRRDQLKQQQALTDMQYQANYGLMKGSYAEQKALWDATNAGAQMKHLRDAGLNPALMYAKGGVGGSTGGGGASVGGGQASNTAQMQQVQSQQTAMGMAMMKMQSEIELNRASANKLNAEIPKVQTETKSLETGIGKINAEIQNIMADTSLKGEQAKLSELQQTSTKIANEFNEEQNVQLLKQTFQQIRELTARANVAESTQQSLVELAQNNVKMVASNILLNNSKLSLNESEKKLIKSKIDEIANTITITGKQLHINSSALDQALIMKEMELSAGSITKEIRGILGTLRNAITGTNDYRY